MSIMNANDLRIFDLISCRISSPQATRLLSLRTPPVGVRMSRRLKALEFGELYGCGSTFLRAPCLDQSLLLQ